MKRKTNAQDIMKSLDDTAKMRRELRRKGEIARKRMQELLNQGFGKAEFFINNKEYYDSPFGKMPMPNSRKDIAKELAKMNRFLNSKSSTPKGLKESELKFIEAINNNFGEDILNEKNVRDFQKFMRLYREKYADQTQIDSDKVVDAFKEAERLKINKEDILANIELFIEKEEELSNMNLEDMFEDGVIDRRRRFKLDDYLK